MKKVYSLMLMAVMLFIGGTVKAQCTDYETLPYSTGFEGYTSLPSCWIRTATGTSGAGTFPSCYEWAPNARTGNVYFEFESTNGSVEVAALPLMQNINSLMLTMWISAQSSYLPTVFEVGVLEEDSTFVPVDTLTLITSNDWGSGYHEYTVFFANYTGYGERIAMRAHRTSGQYTVMIDDIAVSEFTGCYPVDNITVSGVDSADATISWTDPLNSSASYVITYWAGTDTLTEYSYTTSVTLTNLNANSQYNFIVMADCGSGSMAAPAGGSFRTACGSTPIPFSENFEAYTTMAPPPCWTVLSGNPTVRNTMPHAGSKHLDFRGAMVNAIALPPMDQPTGDLQVRFWTRPETYTSNYPGVFVVGYMTDLNNDSTFVQLASWAYNEFSAYEEKEVPMVGAPDNAYIVLRQNANSNNWYWYVDDLVVEPIPSCAHPVSVTVDSATASSADISIIGTGTEYRIYWTDGTVTDSADVADSVYTIGGLNASTSYTVTVVTVCDDGTITTGVSTSFRTPCDAGSCDVEIAMTDSYGDGWNGAAIYGYANSDLVFQADVPSGSSSSFTYSHCSTDTLVLRWHTGTYDSETGFTISVAGLEMASGSGTSYTNNGLIGQTVGCPSCGAPTNLVIGSISSDGATALWTTNGGTEFRIYYSDGTTTDSVDVYDSTYTFTGLTASTLYSVSVATICSDGSTAAGNPVTFRTMCADGGCQVVINMTGDYSDSWEYAGIYGDINGTNLFVATINGYSTTGTYTYDLCGTDTLTLRWMQGMYDEECNFVVTLGGSPLVSGNGSNYSEGAFIATSYGCPTCPSPTTFSASNITTDSASIGWMAGGTETEWLVTVGDSSFIASSSSVVLENLTPNTYYNVQIRAICGADDTSNALMAGFRTACGAMVIPFTENFEGLASSVAPTCWDVISGEPYVSSSSYNAHAGSQYLHFTGDYVNAIALPVTSLPTGSLQVRLWTRPESFTSSSCGSFSVGYMTDINNDSTFVALATWNYNEFSDYEEKEVPMIGAPSNSRIVLRQDANSAYYYWYVDDLTIEPMPACPRPNLAMVDSTSTIEAYLSWTPTSANTYEVAYSTVNDVTDSSVQSITVSDTVVTVTGLNAMTQYFFWVRALCGTDTSDWRAIGSAATQCDTTTCDVVIDMDDSFGDGWNGNAIYVYQAGYMIGEATIASGSTGVENISVCSSLPVEFRFHVGSFASEASVTIYDGGGSQLYTQSDMSSVSEGALLATTASPCPTCIAPRNITLTDVSDVSLSISWTAGSTETEWSVTCNGNTMIVNTPSAIITGLDAATAYTVQISAICSASDTSFGATATFVTDICASAVTIENWDNTMSATTTTYGPIGYSLYNYSYVQTIIDSANLASLHGDITAFAFGVGSFISNSSTMYENMTVYMSNVSESNLNGGFIHPDATHVFQKVIDSASFNYTESGWQIHNLDSAFTWDGHSNLLISVKRDNGDYSGSQTFLAHTASASKMCYVYQDSGPYDPATVSDGTATATVGDIRLISCGAGCPSPVVSTVTYDYGSATVTVTGNDLGYELTYGTDPSNLGNAMTSTTGVFELTGLTPATQYFVAVTQMCDSGVVSSPAMRNFTTDSLPCFEPTDVTVNGTTFNSAEISWTSNGNATSWVVSVSGAGATRYDTASTNPYTVTNLYSDQQYTVMVKAICGNGAAESGWSEPVSFTTDVCTKVSGVTVGDITATTATVSWNAVTGTMGYKVYYGDPEFYDTEALTADVAAGTTSYTITGLAPETPYEVYVRNRCTETLYSAVTNEDRVGFITAAGGSEGIYDVESGTLTLYPNPASSQVTLSVSGMDGMVEVEIVDMNGRVAGSWQLTAGQMTLDVSTLSQGAYFVRVTGEHQTAVRKLIVK